MIINVARKEIKSMFASPMGWVILSLLMCAFGWQYLQSINDYLSIMSGAMRPAERVGVTQFTSQSVYGLASYIMLFAVPLLSMRLIAEERRNQTLPFLFTAPLSLTEIVVGKFVGLVAFLSLLNLFVTVMLSTLIFWADIDFGILVANSLGLLLMTASYSSLGLYFSSRAQQPVIAAILTFVVLSAMLIMHSFLAGNADSIFTGLSLVGHLQSFTSGLIDTGDIAYFILFTATFLTLTVRRLDADRLRG